MTGKARLTALAGKLRVNQKTTPVETKPGELVANRPHGEKGNYIKITVTLPSEVYKLIADEAARRKMTKEPNPQLSAVIREAVVAAFGEKS